MLVIEHHIRELANELSDTTPTEFLGGYGSKREYLGLFDGRECIIKVLSVTSESNYPQRMQKISNIRSDLLPETYELVVKQKSNHVRVVLVQEAFDGVPMSERSNEKNRETVIDIAFRVLKSLQQYHDSGITHGDVRQDTVFVTSDDPVLLEPTPKRNKQDSDREFTKATDTYQVAKLIQQLLLPKQGELPIQGQIPPDEIQLPETVDKERAWNALEPVMFPQSSLRTLGEYADTLRKFR